MDIELALKSVDNQDAPREGDPPRMRPAASDRARPLPAMTKARSSGRRAFLSWIGYAFASVVQAAAAQQTHQVPRLGFLWINSPGTPRLVARLREGLLARGYEVGRDISIDDRSLVKGYEELAPAAERLVREKCSVILALGTTAALAASRATREIPIVVVGAGDLVRLGVAESLARPGGNVTGFTTLSEDLAGKRLEILREIAPSMRRFAVILYPGSVSEVDSLRNYEDLARSSNLELRSVEIRNETEIEPAIAAIATMKVQAIVVAGSTLFGAHPDRIVAAITRLRLPAMYSNPSLAEAGGLVAYVPDISENFYRAAVYIDKILKGAKPADLPIEQPRKWELIINLKAAKALGLALAPPILARADRVIE